MTAADRWSQVPRARRTNPLAIAALVCGIVSFCGLPPAAIAAIVLGHKAVRQIRRTGDDGYGLAKAGLILGYLATLTTVVALLIALAANGGGQLSR